MFISALGAELPHYRNLHAGSPHYDPHYRPRYEALVGAPVVHMLAHCASRRPSPATR